jgi:hypothetical protein
MPKVSKSAPKKKKQARMAGEMKKFAAGALHSGSKSGPVVKNPAQAKAIGLSESGQAKSASGPPLPMKSAMGGAKKKSSSVKKRKPRNSGRGD